MRTAVLAAVVLASAPARADQVQADLGLSVIALGYEQPVSEHTAFAIEGGLFGTYFLPWFDLGDKTVGAIGGVRATWFRNTNHAGFYLTPYLRTGYVRGKHEDGDGVSGDGGAVTAGMFAGWDFRATPKIDVRIGGGAQYIYMSGEHGLEASTPFVALDFTIGYRL